MEQRHITGKSHWYHETQSSTAEYDVLPLVPEAAKVSDPFLLDVILDEETLAPFLSWLVPARVLAVELFPDQYSAAIFLIPICISFDTAEKRRYATYLILNRRFSFEF